MCSEFVAYCYQSEAGKPAIRIDAKRTCPMRLENYLNQHPETFRFAGAIDQVGGELRENFTHAGKSAEGAAKKISGGAKKISGGAKKAASALKKLF